MQAGRQAWNQDCEQDGKHRSYFVTGKDDERQDSSSFQAERFVLYRGLVRHKRGGESRQELVYDNKGLVTYNVQME